MFPLFDDNSKLKSFFTPVNTLLIIVNVIIFIFYQHMGDNVAFNQSYSMIPAEIVNGKDIILPEIIGKSPQPVYFTILSSMFMHGDWLHLLGNMWFLFLLGNNVEDSMGSVRYLLFYLFCGVFASLFFILLIYGFDNNPIIYSLGASGAISGVTGAYLLLFPRNQIQFGWIIWRIPLRFPVDAYVWGLMWLFSQIIGSLLMLSTRSYNSGIAYGAHLGGFIFGCFIIWIFYRKKRNLLEVFPNGKQQTI